MNEKPSSRFEWDEGELELIESAGEQESGNERTTLLPDILRRLNTPRNARALNTFLTSGFANGFCPTGEGGGIDNSCGGAGGSSADDTVPSLVTLRSPTGKAAFVTVEKAEDGWAIKNQEGQRIKKRFKSREEAKSWAEENITKELARRHEQSIKEGTYVAPEMISPVEENKKLYGQRQQP